MHRSTAPGSLAILPVAVLTLLFLTTDTALAQSRVAGTVRDDAGGPLAGAVVALRGLGPSRQTVTDARGEYRFDRVAAGETELRISFVNFTVANRRILVPGAGTVREDAVLHLVLSADVTVTEKSTFVNLADAERPSENLVGIAQSASQGAITGRQLDARPLLRTGEVLETVPGVVISQHSGEGKANQYYLRGFNLDHGTDFATTVASMPVNMPTHGHGHGYSDLNFVIPELISGVQFSKGPYFADQGDFATAGAATIRYTNTLARPLLRVTGGGQGFGRALMAASPRAGSGRLLAALEVHRNDGPWRQPDDYRTVNGVMRYSRGNELNGIAFTFMGYRGTWRATDQIPQRAVEQGDLSPFDGVDSTGGGDSSRYSGSFEWQRSRGHASTSVSLFGIAYDLDLYSNFTYRLQDPAHGDQFRQADRRVVSGAEVTHRRIGRWADRPVQLRTGLEVRHDNISNLGLYRTTARQLLGTVRQDAVHQTSTSAFAQQEIQWTPWLRTLAGLRLDGFRFDVHAGSTVNSGRDYEGLVSPKGGAVLGPWRGTELYANAGYGFHSNDARGATITVDPATGAPADRVTPLARVRGAEFGARSVRFRHLHTTLSVWTLALDSELIFVGDAGTTEPGRPSRRYGVEWTTYYTARPWLVLDGEVSMSRARFVDGAAEGEQVPGAVGMVISGGVAIDDSGPLFGSVRWRHVGRRALTEDGSIRSSASSLVNLDTGYRFTSFVRLALDVFNVFDSRDRDIEYFYRSRLPGEPLEGVEDIHYHPALPRTARVSLIVGF
jgi:hypothetical protein